MRLHRAPRPVLTALPAVGLLLVLVACGSSSTPSQTSSSTPTASSSASSAAPSTAACADVAALKSSLEALAKVKPRQDGVAALNAAIANVQSSLDAAAASASANLQPAVAQVKTAFAGLQTAVTGLTTDNLSQQAPSVVAALQQVGIATAAFVTTLTQSCPGS